VFACVLQCVAVSCVTNSHTHAHKQAELLRYLVWPELEEGDDVDGVLQCCAVRSSVLQCGAVCCNAEQCVAMCCSDLQCVAMRSSAEQCVAMRSSVES